MGNSQLTEPCGSNSGARQPRCDLCRGCGAGVV